MELVKDDYFFHFEKAFKRFAKEVEMPGFGAGRAPLSQVRKEYGQGLFEKTLIERAAGIAQQQFLQEGVPLMGDPLLLKVPDSISLTQPETYIFEYEVGLRPKSTILLPAKDVVFTHYKIRLNEAVVQATLLKVRDYFKTLEEVAQVTDFEKDLVLISGNPKAYKNQNTEQLLYALEPQKITELPSRLQDQIMGAKAGDVLLLNPEQDIEEEPVQTFYLKTILEMGNIAEDTNLNRDYEITVIKVGRYVPATLNEALYEATFPGKNITTEAGFWEAAYEPFQADLDFESDQRLEREMLKYLLDTNEIALPEAYLKNLLLQSKGPDNSTPLFSSAEELETRLPLTRLMVRASEIRKQLSENWNLSVSEEEVRAGLWEQARAEASNTGNLILDAAYNEILADRELPYLLQNELEVQSMQARLLMQKICARLRTLVTIEEKEISEEAFESLPYIGPHGEDWLPAENEEEDDDYANDFEDEENW